ncbi:MAG TPA: hypothetical protein VLG46_13540, partial [Anaerolineae bacterium]|nr:hypothetical protein [Anaerolineae bacterium]
TFCFATFPTVDWLQIGRAVYMASDEMNNPETGEFSLGFGSVKVSSRGRAFTIPFERDELVRGGYLDSDAKAPTREALLFKICDTIPQEWLYSEESYLRQAFGMGTDTQRLFIVEAWEHPSVDEVYGDEIRPSQWPDIVALVEAVCTKKTKPKLTGIPNTSWRQRYSKK